MIYSKKTIDFDSFIDDAGIDRETMKELYEVFLEEVLEEKEKLQYYFFHDNNQMMKKTIHNIKGISGSYKAYEIYDIAKELDEKLKNEEKTKSDFQIEELIKYIEIASQEINLYFENK
ncbi:Hpt domain-containing protein [Herbivorax sp. ANBcel31]|uniref:Hpt domain-containing protein n=1 Tax=Herbivorax sp. ANBcel31 TaxID=3069754 RepID=UPI0027B707E9|nr:Hpt domain-containing protein [Herbivorax sp. ANBcel31]MDQ2084922.1 Hpt domain-containing protein [Herbivorax sp. ANBcel31]